MRRIQVKASRLRPGRARALGRSTVASPHLRPTVRATCPTGLAHSSSPVLAPVTATARTVSVGTVVSTSISADAASASLRHTPCKLSCFIFVFAKPTAFVRTSLAAAEPFLQYP